MEEMKDVMVVISHLPLIMLSKMVLNPNKTTHILPQIADANMMPVKLFSLLLSMLLLNQTVHLNYRPQSPNNQSQFALKLTHLPFNSIATEF
jgi:hypothetical protein